MPEEAIRPTHRPDRVYLAEPNGYCAGVLMAIKALVWMVLLSDSPVYCYHEIIHNSFVVEAFKRAGVVFVDSIEQVPRGAPVMLSAHGSAPEVVAGASERAGVVIDSVCPLVVKVHHEVKRRAAKGFDIIYVGHRNHDEAVGTVARAPENITLVEPEDGLVGFRPRDPRKVALFAQTTLGLHEWEAVRGAAEERYPELETSRKSDLCFATTNRQNALREMSSVCDLILVVGSANSSNTNALVRTAHEKRVPAHRIDSKESIRPEWLEDARVVGVTAGASVPDQLVREVISHLDPVEGWRLFRVVDEEEYFPLPRSLRQLLDGLESVLRIGFGAPRSTTPLHKFDRGLTAEEALDALASNGARR